MSYVGVSLSLLRMVEKPLHELGVPGKCSNRMLSLVSHLGVKDEYLSCVALVLLRRMGYPLSTPPSRAPRWAGSTSDEYITYFMASSKPSKRPYPDSDSDSDPLPTTFPNFIVLESLDEKQLTKLKPIVIEKKHFRYRQTNFSKKT